jgi:hypothetical protein
VNAKPVSRGALRACRSLLEVRRPGRRPGDPARNGHRPRARPARGRLQRGGLLQLRSPRSCTDLGRPGHGLRGGANGPCYAASQVDGSWRSLAFRLGVSALSFCSRGPWAFSTIPESGRWSPSAQRRFGIYSLAATRHATFMREMNFRTIELRFPLLHVVAGSVSGGVAETAPAGA